MAGRPLRRRMIAELEKRARAVGEDVTAIDVVCEWTAEGKTLADLARDLTDTTGQTISTGVLSSWLNSTNEGKAKIAAARALAAHIHAEDSVAVMQELVDQGTEVSREEVALRKALADTKQWLASKWNRGQYGADAAVQIQNNTFNLAEAHLAALAQRKQIKAQTQPALPPVEADYELVTDEEKTDALAPGAVDPGSVVDHSGVAGAPSTLTANNRSQEGDDKE